jgi:hypothetical protein
VERGKKSGMASIEAGRILHRVLEDRLLGDDVEQLAGHEGRESKHLLPDNPHPLGMRSGHGDQAIAALHALSAAEQLGLFATHHVGGIDIALGKPRQDADIARSTGNADCFARNIGEFRRHIDIAGLDPALLGADHAAHDHR